MITFIKSKFIPANFRINYRTISNIHAQLYSLCKKAQNSEMIEWNTQND